MTRTTRTESWCTGTSGFCTRISTGLRLIWLRRIRVWKRGRGSVWKRVSKGYQVPEEEDQIVPAQGAREPQKSTYIRYNLIISICHGWWDNLLSAMDGGIIYYIRLLEFIAMGGVEESRRQTCVCLLIWYIAMVGYNNIDSVEQESVSILLRRKTISIVCCEGRLFRQSVAKEDCFDSVAKEDCFDSVANEDYFDSLLRSKTVSILLRRKTVSMLDCSDSQNYRILACIYTQCIDGKVRTCAHSNISVIQI